MASSCRLPLAPQSIRFTPTDQSSRPVFVYSGDKRTDVRKVDARGNPVEAFEATLEIAGQRLGKGRIECGQRLPQDVPLGTVFAGSGEAAELRISNQRDAFDLRIALALAAFEPNDGSKERAR
jgi:hypothetical protein